MDEAFVQPCAIVSVIVRGVGDNLSTVSVNPGASVVSFHSVRELGRRMDFYTLDYIVSHQSLDSTRRVAAVIVFLVVALAFSVLYLRNRAQTRWRDAGIGLLVLSLILLGIQAEQYTRVSHQLSQSQLLVHFIEGVATDQGVDTGEVLVNSTSLQDGMIVRFKEEDYLVHLNDDNNSYVLERTHIINHAVYVNGEH